MPPPPIKALNNFCRELSLTCMISSPTRYSVTRSSILDVFLSDSNIIATHWVINYNISDHLAIYLTIKKTKETNRSTTFSGRSYLRYDKALFQERLFYSNWGKFYAMKDVNQAWDFFYNIILRESDSMCPCREFKIRRDRPPWFNFEMIELCANRDHLYSLGRKTKNNHLINEARKLKNLAKHSLTSAKKAYYLGELTKYKSDPKKFWYKLHSLLSEGGKTHIDKTFDINTDSYAEGETAADLLNQYYVTIADKLTGNVPTTLPEMNHITTLSHYRMPTPISERLLRSILKDLDSTKSSGCLCISSKLYIDAFEVLIEQLLHMFNLSLRTQLSHKLGKSQ